jgi:hypothetical protein
MRIFSSRVIDAPGLCSPSRKVVSNMIKRCFIVVLLFRPLSSRPVGEGVSTRAYTNEVTGPLRDRRILPGIGG